MRARTIDSLQLWMTMCDVYYQTSAYLRLIQTGRADLTLHIDQIRWQGMCILLTHVCCTYAPEAAVGYRTTKGQLVATYDPG